MADIRIDLSYPIVDGQPLTFRAPCDCTSVTGIKVYYPNGETTESKEFTLKDAHCNDLTEIGDLFASGAYVKVVIDTTQNAAYIQNADTNAYLEGELAKKYSPTNKPTPTDIGAATTETYTATVTTNWKLSNNGTYYYQDISVSGILETDTPIVDILPGSDSAANMLYIESMCKVIWITTLENAIRVRATEAISTAFPIQIKVVR